MSLPRPKISFRAPWHPRLRSNFLEEGGGHDENAANARELWLLPPAFFCNCSNAATTSAIVGLLWGFRWRHCCVSSANLQASSIGKLFPSASSTRLSILSWLKRGSAHCTRFPIVPSVYFFTAPEPDKICRSTTPKQYTSTFTVKCPAKYNKPQKETC